MRWHCLTLLSLLLAFSARAQDTAPVEPAEEEDRVVFSFQVGAERGGGRVEVLAGEYEYQADEYFLATGGVKIRYRDVQVQADVIRVDIPTDMLTAEGSVVLDEGPSRLVGDALEYNLETRTGRVVNATAYVENDYVFSGSEIAKVGAETYTLDDGVFTSCSEENPPWSIRTGHARVTLEDYARIKNARMRFKKVPVFWVPYMVWPTKTERSSGLLVPQPGYSNRRGAELSLAYYKTLGRSADTTFFFDLSTKDYFGFGNEVRYRPSETTEGLLEAFVLTDPELDPAALPPDLGIAPELLPEETRWKIKWFHDSRDLWGGFRGVIDFQDYSDPAYRQDFERAVGRQTNSFIYSRGYLTRNFGQQSFNLMVDQRERVRIVTAPDERIRGGEIIDTRRQLPEIEYRLRPTRLGATPLYFSLDTNLHYLSIEQLNTSTDVTTRREYGRADLLPSFSLPLSSLPWLSVKVDAGGRATYYGEIDRTTERPDGTSESEKEQSLERVFGAAGAEIVGPSISRIFERAANRKKKPGRFSKFKHVVEPRWDYVFRGVDMEEQDEAPLFDEVDRVRRSNQATVAIINRLLAKPADEEEGGAFEIASLEIAQSFSLDDELPLQTGRDEEGQRIEAKEGPIRAIFRFNPSPVTSFKAEAQYNTLTSEMRSLSLSGGTRFGHHALAGSLFTRWDSAGEVSSNQARLATTLALLPNRLTLDAHLSFDIEASELLQQRYFIDYQGSCYSLRFELRESKFGDLEDRDFRFAFTLKNVGTFIDLNGSVN